MKKIDLTGAEFHKKQFFGLLQQAPQRRPFTTGDVLRAVSLQEKASENNDSVLLEDADYAFYRSIIDAQDWAVATPELGEFLRRIIDAPDVKIEEAKPDA